MKVLSQGFLSSQITYKRRLRKNLSLIKLLWWILWNRKHTEQKHKRENKPIIENVHVQIISVTKRAGISS